MAVKQQLTAADRHSDDATSNSKSFEPFMPGAARSRNSPATAKHNPRISKIKKRVLSAKIVDSNHSSALEYKFRIV
jgi:hypothetical protein